jgi:hypothetical protein
MNKSMQVPPCPPGRGIRTLLILGIAAAFVVTTAPQSHAQGSPRAAQAREALVAKIAGKKIHKDNATGQVREITVEEAGALIDSIITLTNRSGDGIVPVAHPSGAEMASVDGHFGHVMIAKFNADGTASLRCVTSAAEAADFLAAEPLEVQ